MKKLALSLFLLTLCIAYGSGQALLAGDNTTSKDSLVDGELKQFSIPFANNVWVNGDRGATERLIDIKKKKLNTWNNPKDKLAFYFYSETSGKLALTLVGDFPKTGKLIINFAEQSRKIDLGDAQQGQLYIGQFAIKKVGYQKLLISQVGIPVSSPLVIDTVQANSNEIESLNFITNKEVYFARRGPSAHLKYQLPDNDTNWQWLYSELTVPAGFDPVGSYFMANGFAQGYFGMQVNSDSERRMLFSVWSPFKTQDPKNVPINQQIKLVKKGENVQSGKFGNEGVGGQSYKKFIWQAGNTYKFLLKVTPIANNHTEFTAYFYAPEVNEWQLMATFQRPKTQSYLQRPHSFIENFIPSQGDKVRKAYYGNQWVADVNGNWSEITQAQVTYDNTARNKYRFDYQGGSESNQFYLQNGGFSSQPTPYNSGFMTKASNIAPKIDFNALP